eukprot:TRINITY_DN8558_c0_g1_i1.p1 TRINITY_DN8558_c0_g1~~TRINITY_DN8558_c0_g1_i1.p1  ORF type:complete len:376 (-),score=37.30 TRINITY_DN8558_c0_g1_i1:60-1118(-)
MSRFTKEEQDVINGVRIASYTITLFFLSFTTYTLNKNKGKSEVKRLRRWLFYCMTTCAVFKVLFCIFDYVAKATKIDAIAKTGNVCDNLGNYLILTVFYLVLFIWDQLIQGHNHGYTKNRRKLLWACMIFVWLRALPFEVLIMYYDAGIYSLIDVMFLAAQVVVLSLIFVIYGVILILKLRKFRQARSRGLRAISFSLATLGLFALFIIGWLGTSFIRNDPETDVVVNMIYSTIVMNLSICIFGSGRILGLARRVYRRLFSPHKLQHQQGPILGEDDANVFSSYDSRQQMSASASEDTISSPTPLLKTHSAPPASSSSSTSPVPVSSSASLSCPSVVDITLITNQQQSTIQM